MAQPIIDQIVKRKSRKAESLSEVQKLLVARKAKTNGRNGATMKSVSKR